MNLAGCKPGFYTSCAFEMQSEVWWSKNRSHSLVPFVKQWNSLCMKYTQEVWTGLKSNCLEKFFVSRHYFQLSLFIKISEKVVVPHGKLSYCFRGFEGEELGKVDFLCANFVRKRFTCRLIGQHVHVQLHWLK